MAKTDTMDPMTAAALLGNSGTNTNPEIQRAMLEYLKLATETLKQTEAEREQERAVLEKQLKKKMLIEARNAEIEESKRLAEELKQKQCSHVNERGGTLISGQRLGGGKISFRCFDCGKQFTSWDQIPGSVRPKATHIGGPTSY